MLTHASAPNTLDCLNINSRVRELAQGVVMRYLIALLIPCVAFFSMGKVFAGILCIILQITLIGWLPAAIWALLAVSSYNADRRTDRIVRAVAPR